MKSQEVLPVSLVLENRVGFSRGIWLVAALFVLLLMPWLWDGVELFRHEGVYAAIAGEYAENLWDPAGGITAKAHQVMLSDAWPLYPWIVSLFYRFMPMESALRLVSVIMWGVLALLAGITAGVRCSKRAGLVAACCCFGSFLVLKQGIWGGPEVMGGCFLLSAQLLFFHYGSRYADWNSAWISAAVFLALGFLTAGPPVIIFFVFPMIFLRRPLSFSGKFRTPGFLAGAILLAVVILVWALPIGLNWRQYAENSGIEIITLKSYLRQILLFPVKFPLWMMPWTLVIWMPFCVALQAISPIPVFSRYLRTLFFSMLALVWLIPGIPLSRFFFLLGPLAILTGINYELGVRRYGAVMRRLLMLCGIFFPVAIAVLVLIVFLPEKFIAIFCDPSQIVFRQQDNYTFLMLAAVTALALSGIIFSVGHRRFPIWVQILLIAFGIGVMAVAVHLPVRMMDQSWRRFGNDVRAVVPAGTDKVYKYNIDGLYNGLFYCGLPVQELDSLNSLEKQSDIVYLISSEVPVYPDRIWTPLLPEGYTCRGVEVSVWRGMRRVESEDDPGDDDE